VHRKLRDLFARRAAAAPQRDAMSGAGKSRAAKRPPLARAPSIRGDQFIFVCGLHRSGTSALHRVLRQSDAVSGFGGTGAPEDEGQHLQSVFPPATAFGGPGRFAFDPASRMTESSVRDLEGERDTLLREWGAYFDLHRSCFVEKSPPNLLRARYLQALFPGAKFVFIVRHPIAVSLATESWSKRTRLENLLHWHAAHMLMLRDIPHVEHKIVLRYEDLCASPSASLTEISRLLNIAPPEPAEELTDRNEKHFGRWESAPNVDMDIVASMMFGDDSPASRLGYHLEPPYIR